MNSLPEVETRAELSDEALRIGVAECLGWELLLPPHNGRMMGRKPLQINEGSPNWLLMPDWPNDLNACAAFEKGLTDDEHFDYRLHLWNLTWKNKPWTGLREENRAYFSATARQRCIAFLKVKGKL